MPISIDCFKAYDIRGQIPNQLNPDIAYRIGHATTVFLEAKQIPTTLAGNPVADVSLTLPDRDLQITCVSMGNPHCVTFVDEITDELVHSVGPRIEHDAHFPNRVNVEFVEVLSPQELRQRTWERGSGETLACGTRRSLR